MNLVYEYDKIGKAILCDNEEEHQVMMECKKPYINKSIELLQPFGNVLEVGFGMGNSATKICSYDAVKEYNVIECSPIIWEKFEEFKNVQIKLRPDLKINLIKGRWEDVLKTTGIFDCIYFDECDNNDNIILYNYSLNSLNRLNIFLLNILNKKHTKIGSKISFINAEIGYKNINCINCINLENIEYKIKIPENNKYAIGEKMYISIITKIADEDIDLESKIYKKIEESVDNKFKVNNIQSKNKKLFNDIKTRSPSCGLIVIDNFYNNPYETREFVLTQEFLVRGNYPGQRTISYANDNLKSIIQKYVEPFGGNIIDFPIPKQDGSDAAGIYNGSFQFTTSRDRSWVHIDGYNNWAGVLYLTPNAPLTSGTSFYKFYDGTTCAKDMEILDNKQSIDNYSQDMTKWEKVDQVGNVFNRLILFNSNRFHMSMDYFGYKLENGRLFQVFFFSTER